MRVTNGMLTNTTLNGLYKSTGQLNKTYGQMTSGKKIQYVSDNPILAGRAMKLATNVNESDQYIANVKSANSWMEITGGALNNMTKMLQQIREKVNQAANSSLEVKDKKAIQTEIEEVWKQISEEANVTYDGRYVFSGYKTDQPLTLTKDQKLEADTTLESSLALRSATSVEPDSVVKKDSILAGSTVLKKDTNLPSGTVLPKGTKLSADDAKNLLGIDPAAAKYKTDAEHIIPAGTKVSAATANAILGLTTITEDYTFTTDHTIAKGEEIDKAAAQEALGVEISSTEYIMTADLTLTGDQAVQGEITLGAEVKVVDDMTLKGKCTLGAGTNLEKESKLIKGTVLKAGTVNPNLNGKMEDDTINYQIGVNSKLQINTLGMDKTMNTIAECFGELYNDITACLNGTMSNSDLSKKYSTKLGELDKILADISEKTSDLGSRMSRADYVKSRLSDQHTTFKNLLSETEDVDIEEVYTNFNTQYATYQSALQATSKIIKNTLADYL